jgi:acetyltransferase-like isoleucine patch superfamily enzyme
VPVPDRPVDDLLGRLGEDVASGEFPERGHLYLTEILDLAAFSLRSGDFSPPPDPFKGDGPEPEANPDLYYTMFWRMFDRTPAAMIQGLAIPLRRILAQRLFRHCGTGVIIHHDVLFSQGHNISLGDGVLVNRNSMLDDRGPIDVGAYTMVAAGVTIETHTHPFDNFDRPIAHAGRGTAAVRIGANSVIGYNSVVMAGSNIGYRAIVGANSVVTGTVADFTVVGGVPAKPIKQILPDGEDPLRERLEGDEGADHRQVCAEPVVLE